MKYVAKVIFFLLLCYLSWFYLFVKPGSWTLLDNVNLGVHEFGHLLADLFSNNQVFIVFGGTLLQIMFPIIFLLYFLKRNDMYGMIFSIFWVGQNLINVSIYIMDAMCMCLPLLGGEHSLHDWNYILSNYGILQKYGTISSVVSVLGKSFILISLFLGFKNFFSVLKDIKNFNR